MDRRDNAVYRERAGSAQETVLPVQVLALTCSVFLANLFPPPGLSFLISKKRGGWAKMRAQGSSRSQGQDQRRWGTGQHFLLTFG